jgi:hypothetical protein
LADNTFLDFKSLKQNRRLMWTSVSERAVSDDRLLVAAGFANDDTALAAMSADGTLGYWPLFPTTEALKEFAEEVAPRRLTLQQIGSYLEQQPSKR